jgi:hypothetical protein
VHLRLCLTCGHVGCCDTSKNKHTTKHFRTVGHPVIQSYEPGEHWVYCYVDDLLVPLGSSANVQWTASATASQRIPATPAGEIVLLDVRPISTTFTVRAS